jgi:hypothetical protein
MAAVLFLVAILGLLFAGRTQARAADYGRRPLFSFQLWQLAAALALPIVCAAPIPMIAKVTAVAATASAFVLSVFRARHAHDPDDLYF